MLRVVAVGAVRVVFTAAHAFRFQSYVIGQNGRPSGSGGYVRCGPGWNALDSHAYPSYLGHGVMHSPLLMCAPFNC